MKEMARKSLFVLVLSFFLILFFSQAEAKMVTVYLSWDASADEASWSSGGGYQVYWGTSRLAVQNLTTANKISVGKRHSACVQIDDVSPVYFFVVTAINPQGGESVPSNLVYDLFGNIVGDSNDGTPPSSARVDGADQAVIGIYFGRSGITHQTYNCQSDFVITLPSDLQKADLNKDGRINGFDLMELGVRFGNTANQ